MNNKEVKPSKLFGNKRSAQEQEIREREIKARRSYEAEMDRHEKYIHHLNRENGIGVKSNVQK